MFRPNPATDTQLTEIRRLARWPGLPQPESIDYAEQRIQEGMTVTEAWTLIGVYGRRIRQIGPVEAMAAEQKRLAE